MTSSSGEPDDFFADYDRVRRLIQQRVAESHSTGGQGRSNPSGKKRGSDSEDAPKRYPWWNPWARHSEREAIIVSEAMRVFKENPLGFVHWQNERNLATMRSNFGRRLMWLLYGETLAIFYIVISQGFGGSPTPFWGLRHFELKDPFFSVFVNATIIQVVALVYVVVESLFPRKNKEQAGLKPPATAEGVEMAAAVPQAAPKKDE